ncbi:DNA-directed RNA polymerase subunit omega [Shinella sp. AETb1-6]|jgi:DNA-directed RNA polymerase subunit omega|uniref:DNA-directed RNA polymerase subunit omega n=1 Tax=Rhizobiaceae TaxID=82115 RepID=UPI001371921A|nr:MULTISPECIES: DNA-directed RNA polymerase subunit omega [Rhizobiaceae]MXN53219.1 DNA-directed RNA polymerase subunit omega [Shinella sp. AETb1-6]QYA17387.1 DNA-directed RNA polymerase subunit omega [Rhizobium sp. AB2/73]UEQ85707.1 DNA-directed RNA polymerase subunit omega [Rhizobium sp. AB2/73]
MDPLVVFDCQKILPNRFALALAAAARSRALNRGAEPRLDRQGVNASELALLEIAHGAFVEDELAPYLFPSSAGAPLLTAPSTTPEFRGDGRSSAAAAPVSSLQEAVH